MHFLVRRRFPSRRGVRVTTRSMRGHHARRRLIVLIFTPMMNARVVVEIG